MNRHPLSQPPFNSLNNGFLVGIESGLPASVSHHFFWVMPNRNQRFGPGMFTAHIFIDCCGERYININYTSVINGITLPMIFSQSIQDIFPTPDGLLMTKEPILSYRFFCPQFLALQIRVRIIRQIFIRFYSMFHYQVCSQVAKELAA